MYRHDGSLNIDHYVIIMGSPIQPRLPIVMLLGHVHWPHSLGSDLQGKEGQYFWGSNQSYSWS